MNARESRPAHNRATQSKSAATSELRDSISAPAELRAGFGVHVVSTCSNGTQRGQTFATLAAAERKIARQRDRGLPVQAVLVQLVPLPWSVIGGDDTRDNTVSDLVVVNGHKVTHEAYAAYAAWRDGDL